MDHGKSTLVRQLTGTDPDRWPEEHRRGLTLDLGFAWTRFPDGCSVAFVDVPGHERFVGNMLAGVGPVSAVLFVVAADQGWQAQSDEHRDALHALGVRHGLLVITRCDLADPEAAREQALEQLRGSTLADLPVCTVSGATSNGVAKLRAELDALAHRMPAPATDGDPRMWVDRAFTIHGAGTVVTGTLPSGQLHVGQRLDLLPTKRAVTVRGVQALGAECSVVSAVARVALNLRGVEHHEIRRGHALIASGGWWCTDVLDVRVAGVATDALPSELVAHLGTAALAVGVRPLGTDTARLRLHASLPLRIGDRMVLRDPGKHRIRGSALVLDVCPPALRRRGAARRRAAVLDEMDGVPDARAELRRRGLVRADALRAMGIDPPATDTRSPWLLAPEYRAKLANQLTAIVDEYEHGHPLDDGMPAEPARQALGLPDRALLGSVAGAAEIPLRQGRLRPGNGLPATVARAVSHVRTVLADRPFQAPTAAELDEIGVADAELAVAARAGCVLRLAPGIVLGPDAAEQACAVLATLEQPFTLSTARQALATSRRVAVPLLEHLARTGRTRHLPDGTHYLVSSTS